MTQHRTPTVVQRDRDPASVEEFGEASKELTELWGFRSQVNSREWGEREQKWLSGCLLTVLHAVTVVDER